MERENVIAILHFYRDVDKSIKFNERVIQKLDNEYYTTLGAVNMDGMPHGKGMISSPVENTVLNVPDSVSATINNLKKENQKLERLKSEILKELNCLNYHQRAVILDFYIYGMQWEQISVQIHYSQRQCRNIRDHALGLLGIAFSKNMSISRCQFSRK